MAALPKMNGCADVQASRELYGSELIHCTKKAEDYIIVSEDKFFCNLQKIFSLDQWFW
jgi:hypothetical protein